MCCSMRNCLFARVTLHFDFSVTVTLKCFNFSRASRVLLVLPSKAGVRNGTIVGLPLPIHFLPCQLVSLQLQGRHWVASIVGRFAGFRMPIVDAMCLLWISNVIACGFGRQGVDSKRLVVELCLSVWSAVREESPTFPISSCPDRCSCMM